MNHAVYVSLMDSSIMRVKMGLEMATNSFELVYHCLMLTRELQEKQRWA